MSVALAILAVAAGVLLPKALPAALPSSRASGNSRWRQLLELLPPAILGALTALTALGGRPGPALRLPVVLAVAAAVVLAGTWEVVRRRRRGRH